jgi:hypothetical protein
LICAELIDYYHVWAEGSLSKFLSKALAILNLFIPPIPERLEKPSSGTLEEPMFI